MIKAIFYARFHPEKGPIIAHQVPQGPIVTSTPTVTCANTAESTPSRSPAASTRPLDRPTTARSAAQSRPRSRRTPTPADEPLLDFPLLSPYLIPPQALCNQLLTLRSPTTPHLIISHPVCIVDPARYERNEFIFNLGIVVADERAGPAAHSKRRQTDAAGAASVDALKAIVRKVARTLRDLEVEKGWLARDEREEEARRRRVERRTVPGEGDWERLERGSRVYALCEMVLEDLNCYGECMIPIDETTTLSLRTQASPAAAPPVAPHHVPILLVAPDSPRAATWDLAVQLLLPHMDGVRSVARIAALADADVAPACGAVARLVRHGCAVLLDLFSFGASYGTTPRVGEALVRRADARREAARFVALPGAEVDELGLVELYGSLRPGVALREWCLEKGELVAGVDVRRLVAYGVVKGFLYRVGKFAVAGPGFGDALAALEDGAGGEGEVRIGRRAEDSADGDDNGGGGRETEAGEAKVDRLRRLVEYLDGRHCFDQICTELAMSDRDVMAALDGTDVQIIYR